MKLLKLFPDDVKMLNLSVSDELKNMFLEYYGIEKLPCLLSYDTIIYDDGTLNEQVKKRDLNEFESTKKSIEKVVNSKRIVIFIKGTPTNPECKFTRELVKIFDDVGLVSGKDYRYFNIFLNQNFRKRLKEINEWPTFPQIYVDKAFLGGLDVVKKMQAKGVFKKYVLQL